MSKQVLRVVNFGSAKGGLATVGYTVYNTDGTTAYARSTSGVVEIGTSTGVYSANIVMPDNDAIVLWDTGEASPRYSTEDYQNQINGISDEVSKIQKIWNSIKNQGEFMATLMDRLGLIEKNEGMKKVNDKLDSLSKKTSLSLTDIEGAFNNAARKISLTAIAPEVKIPEINIPEVKLPEIPDYTEQISEIKDILKSIQSVKPKEINIPDYSKVLSKIDSLTKIFQAINSVTQQINAIGVMLDKLDVNDKDIIKAKKSLVADVQAISAMVDTEAKKRNIERQNIIFSLGHKR